MASSEDLFEIVEKIKNNPFVVKEYEVPTERIARFLAGGLPHIHSIDWLLFVFKDVDSKGYNGFLDIKNVGKKVYVALGEKESFDFWSMNLHETEGNLQEDIQAKLLRTITFADCWEIIRDALDDEVTIIDKVLEQY